MNDRCRLVRITPAWDGFVARCSCEWESPLFPARAEAQAAHAEHVTPMVPLAELMVRYGSA